MPGKKAPAAFKNLPSATKAKAMDILNILLRDGMDEGNAIPIAISRAKKAMKEEEEAKKRKKQKKLYGGDIEESYGIKFEKTDSKVRYRAASGEHECSDCRFYEYYGCSIVEGHIEPSYTCDLWEEKLPSQMPVFAETDKQQLLSPDDRDVKERKMDPNVGGGVDRDKIPSKDFAGKNRSFPIVTPKDVADAASSIGRAGSGNYSADELKRRITAIAKRKGAAFVARLPKAWREAEEPMPENSDKFSLIQEAEIRNSVGDSGRVWEVRCIAPGMSLNHTYYSDDLLEGTTHMFEGVPCFADHADGSRSVRDLVGWFEKARYERGVGVLSEFHALESAEWFLGPFREAYERGKTDLIGFSINGEGARHLDRVEGHVAYVVDAIRTIESVDGVIAPAAGGRVMKLVASRGEEEDAMEELEGMSLEELAKLRPDLVDAMRDAAEAKAKETAEAKVAADLQAIKEAEDAKAAEEAKLQEQKEAEEKAKAEKEAEEAKLSEADKQAKAAEEQQVKLQETLEKMNEQIAVTEAGNRLREKLATDEASKLPKVIKDKLMRAFSGRTFEDDELDKAIEEERNTLKALADERPESFPRVEIGEEQRDRAIKALDGLLSGEDVDGVPAAKTLREAYASFKGLPNHAYVDAHDILRESWSGRLTEGNEDSRLREGNLREEIQTSTWAEVMSDRIHKRLLAIWRLPYLDEWRQVTSSVIAIPDFKTQRRIRVGGYANFASVAQADSYVTVASPTDDEATYAVTKYGGLERLTLEAIADDDVGAVRRIPELLARGGKQTLYESVFDLLRTNPQVTWTTNVSVFDDNNATNVVTSGTDDAVLSDSNLSRAKRLLMEMVGPNNATGGSKPLGLRPSLLLVPPELEATAQRLRENEYAVSLTGSSEGTTGAVATGRERDINVHRNSFKFLPVPYWTDSDRWVLLTDPASHPIIEVGFYQGNQAPDLFVQDMPNVGTMFDSDQITYKSRIIFGNVVLDNRGVIASSEATAA